MIAAAVIWLACGSLSADQLAAEIGRLVGQRVTAAAGGAGYTIDDVAGEGAPRVGRVRADGATLWLDTCDGQTLRLVGPLARPRIAGPGYKVWVLGELGADGSLRARRLGVLAPPALRRAAVTE